MSFTTVAQCELDGGHGESDSSHHDTASDSTQDGDESTESSRPGSQTILDTPPGEVSGQDDDDAHGQFLSFPVVPTSIDGLLLDETMQCELSWPSDWSNTPHCRSPSVKTLIRAAWAMVASRMTDSDKIQFSVGRLETAKSPSSGESGLLGNTVLVEQTVLRANCVAHQTVAEYIQSIQAQAERAPDKGWTQFQHPNNTGTPAASVSGERQMPCTLVLSRCGAPARLGPGASSAAGDDEGVQKHLDGYALVLDIQQHQARLEVEARFDSRFLEPWVLGKLLKRLELLVHQFHEADPAGRLSEVDLLTRDDLEQIWAWNGSLPPPVDRCMHQVFHDMALSQPLALAVDAWDGQLTYQDLDRFSTQLAARLVAMGVANETFVPLCFEKSMWMPVAMMSVLKAGGAFVLLEPSFPEQRLLAMVQGVNASLGLCSAANEPLCSRLLDMAVVINRHSLGSCPQETSGQEDASHDTRHSSDSAMFAVFTSGSTGKPKGAILTHANYASALHHQLRPLGFSRDSRVFDFASYAFDVSVHNVFATLTSGACLCIPSDQARHNDISGAMADMGVTIAHVTPSVSRLISPEAVPLLKTMIFTGEPLSVDDVARWWNKLDIVNEYGPAECTINTVNRDAPTPEAATRIGPALGVSAWIVDPDNHDRLAPVGCVGELLIEGALVGRGYINDPANNARAFVQSPRWLVRGVPGYSGRQGRLYKTGDLVRYNQDGSLTYVGRKDVQVKIRGQRLDLGEIEHWVRSCVSDAHQVVAEVIVPRSDNASPTLAVFIQSRGKASDDAAHHPGAAEIRAVPAETRTALAARLPSYIVPTVFFWMAKLPVTPTGKMNRKSLRELGSSFSPEQLAAARASGHDGHRSKRQPSSEMELRVRDIWARVLGLAAAEVWLDDNFFHLGGDSIHSMKAAADARRLGLQMTVMDIFHHPVLHDLAKHCHALLDLCIQPMAAFELLGDDVHVDSLVGAMATKYNLDPSAIQDAYPCTRLQEGLMFLTSKRPGDYMEQSVLELASDISVDRLRRAWDKTIQAQPILRTRLAQGGNLGLLQLVLDDRAQWTETVGLDRYLHQDRERSMDLGDALSRYALVRDKSGGPRWLVWTVHHAIYDGWSMRLVKDAVVKAYQGQVIDEPSPFQAFIKYVQEQDDVKAAGYWQHALKGFDGAPFPSSASSTQDPVADAVEERLMPGPRVCSRGITVSLLIRAAWALVVGKMTGSDDVLFGSTLYGRNAAVGGLDNMAAPTIATVPVRVRFSKEQTVAHYLQTIQQEAAEMMPFEQTGLPRIASTCPEGRKACRFQTHVVIQPEDDCSGDGVLGQWKSGSQEQWFSTYALTLEVWLGPDGILASAMFDSRVIEPWVVSQMLAQLESAMHQLSHASEADTLSDVDLVTSETRDQIWQWNACVPEGVDGRVEDLLVNQARVRPDSPAICAWDGELAYRELDDLSSRVGAVLAEAGVGTSETLIPLCFDKSMWAAVAIFGVLKANASFILLDPRLPLYRLRAIMRQVKSGVVVTCPSRHQLCSQLAPKTISLDWDMVLGASLERRVTEAAVREQGSWPSSMAYAIFTSGSTGAPKGVMISHTNALSALHHQVEAMGHTEQSRLLDFAGYSFDVSISNIFSMVASGGCLCVPSEDQRIHSLEDAVKLMRVNALDLTPSTLQLLSPERVPEIRTLTLGGEALRAADVQAWWDKARICNAYGPSECTPTSIINYLATSPMEATAIGRGAGVVTWIVDPDDHDELLPVGCTGELLLEGPLVGLGYLGQAEKTESAFIRDPRWLLLGSALHPGRRGRLYKTGDLIRGQRVDPGEIESLLCCHGRVQEAAVVFGQHGKGREARLFAFVTVRSDEAIAGQTKSSDTDALQRQWHVNKMDSWESQFDQETYASIDAIAPAAIGRDFIGWSSMYDGKEIDSRDMNEWLDDTIETILNGGAAGRVLELGTGSGMILFSLARHGLESYVGVEPSSKAVDFTAKTAKSDPALAGKVQVFKGTADDILRRPDDVGRPQLVVINSVLQYFPSQDYLFGIIRSLVGLEGVETIFFGDVRSYALHREFLAARALRMANKDVTLDEFRHIVGNLQRVEPELLVDPGFFTGLPDRLPGIRHVEILPKRMEATNELSSYRYAAVLHVACPQQVQEVSQAGWVDYAASSLDRCSLLRLLEVDRGSLTPTVAISNIPYSKIVLENKIVHLTGDTAERQVPNDDNWLSEVRQEAREEASPLSALNLTELARQAGYQVSVSWARQHSQRGGLDAIFHSPGRGGKEGGRAGEPRALFRFPTDHHGRSMASLSSHPLGQQTDARVQGQLQDMAKLKLPSYMVPHAITILDKMPIDHNGKTDRRLLAESAREQESPPLGDKKLPPSTAQEETLQGIWARVLGVMPDRIGMEDGFIQLGGDSLQAMRIVSAARDAGIKLEVADMFQHATTSIKSLLATAEARRASCSPQNGCPAALTDRIMADIARHDLSVASAQAGAAEMVGETDATGGKGCGRLLTVLLTGANGYIGTQILRQLLEDGRVGRVVAVARGATQADARRRTIEAAKRAQWWTEFHDRTLDVWAGDLAQPRLGLDAANWRSVSDGVVHVVIHNGAAVHFIKSYAALEAANVRSTAELLRATAEVPHMKLVYVSSARFGDPSDEAERDVARHLAANPNGYNETKFVAETLVRRAAARRRGGGGGAGGAGGSPESKFVVVSPGLVVGTPTEGVANADDWLWRMASACMRVGAFAGDESDRWIPVADVGSVAAAVVSAAMPGAGGPVVRQITGGLTMGEFWATVAAAGYRLRAQDAPVCAEAIRRDMDAHKDSHPLQALAHMLDGLGDTAREPWAESWRSGGSGASPTRLRAAVLKSVRFLADVGFLPKPTAAGPPQTSMGAFTRSGGLEARAA
ncbi:AMP-binding enzyme domain-containing protein [Hirsutella rhossiliensis]|uniref:AMP-binding enzyme domain-containing protein n=1 Tax=Hirsutella rhossiliensis TaxID=111463 RepID=A0A9P8MMR8_9HYPO|nr:AMP-binding enzyme domain-containing protein [Hirsutella rhossiliensis]KAH0958157.1 AMP-binding enzyme domain-containing protein [Hirsutella rhossiliensis]